MPGLIRGVARVAVVSGTATAVSNRVSRRQAGRWAQQDQQQEPAPPPEPQAYAQPAAAVPAQGTDMDSKLAQLKDLGDLKEQGVLSEAEFEVQKSKILNS
jgi:Short C-terminal domain